MTQSVHNLFRPLVSQWLAAESVPESPMEGATPELAGFLGATPRDFTFESFLHATKGPGEHRKDRLAAYLRKDKELGWNWVTVEFVSFFQGAFHFYLPKTWNDIRQKGNGAAFRDGAATQQSLFLTTKAEWQPRLEELLGRATILGFDYAPLHRPRYHRWVFVTGGQSESFLTAYGMYSLLDCLIMVRAIAPTAADLRTHLTVLMNSNPWHNWIKDDQAHHR